MTHLISIHKKKLLTLAVLTFLVVAGLVFGFALPSAALAWDDCPRGVTTDCVYPGDCSQYVDTNDDGICDRSQSDPAAATTAATPEAATTDSGGQSTSEASGDALTEVAVVGAASAAGADSTTSTTESSGRRNRSGSAEETSASATATTAATTVTTVSVAAGAIDESGGIPFFTHYMVSPIAIAFFLIYGVSFVLYKTKRMRMATHRKIWNVLLLATFLITGIFGVILTIQLDYTLPFTIPINLLFWHVEAGIVMTLISLFHMGWHFNYYRNLLRTSRRKAREARCAERLRGAEGQLALEARATRSTGSEARRGTTESGRIPHTTRAPRPSVEPGA